MQMASSGTVEIQMPQMGESVTEGTVLEWHKREGEFVEEGETVVEVSTDKIDAEVPAPASGTITRILKGEDETIEVGGVLAELDPAGEPSGDGASAEPAVSGAEGRTAEGAAEPVAEGAAEAVQVGEALAEMAAGAATPPKPAGQERATDREPAAATPVSAEGADGKRASPVARRIAAASGIDLSSVKGSGPRGKVIKADVLTAANGGRGGPTAAPVPPVEAGEAKPLRGPAAMLAEAMNESRSIPTATSFRTVPVDVIDAKRKALNGALEERGMKISFTHLIAWAIVKAAIEWPVMGRSYTERDSKPYVIEPGGVNLGIAVDVERKGSRSLMVPCIKAAGELDFAAFHTYYEDLITKTRENRLTADDFRGTNITLTNPGGLGTVASVPRLMSGQGTIVACGALAYPAEWAHAGPEKLKALGVSKVMTMTSTYDHRIIQGAESGSFLRRIDQLLQGEDGFYEAVAADLGLPESVVASAYPAAASAQPMA